MALLFDPTPIQVTSDAQATPRRFTIRQRVFTVAQVLERSRLDVGLWRWRVIREYFTLLTDRGLLVVIYRDVRGGQWYLDQVLD
jgi:hypothetical protein